MPKPISLQEIKKRLKNVRQDGLILDESTYKSTYKKAKFLFKDGTEWWAIVKNVLNGAKGPTRVTEDELNKRIKAVHGDIVTIDFSTFINVKVPARFIDVDFGEWWTSPSNVYSLGNSHPKRGAIKRRNTCLEKYGSSNPTGNAEVMLKRNKNNIEKYGTAHTMQVPEISLKAAKKSNNSSLKVHWKTKEEIVCQAGYEPKVVDYLNKNKINYSWQSQTFILPIGKTYRPDLFLIDENKWIEIKGFMRKDALEKWDWFKTQFPTAELWDEKKLKEMKIL